MDLMDFEIVKMLNVANPVDCLSLNHMYNVITGNAPAYLCNVEEVFHRYHTRNNRYLLPQVGTQGGKSFKYNAIKLWSGLADKIKKCEDKVTFKQEIYKLYIKYQINDKTYFSRAIPCINQLFVLL